ncbi:MAG: DUF2807 domain-containing protein [Gammaproteobacteria bacterium]
MKQGLIGILLISIVLLTSCATNKISYPSPGLAEETWPFAIDTQPNSWAQGADHWFLTGDPNSTQQMNETAPYMAAISTMEVKVPNFTNIKVSGNFEVQLVGTDAPNRVFVYGPNDGVRQVIVEVRGNTLYLRQPPEACPNVGRTIVRIGIKDLHHLMQAGPGLIEGRQLRSSGLVVHSYGSGDVYLTGKINLCSVINNGAGDVTVFDARANALEISTMGSGSVNVSGHLGMRSIFHRGIGNINVIGVNGGTLNIDADGSGKIGIYGCYDLCRVIARGAVCVYSYCVNSGKLVAYGSGRSHIGMAGNASDLNVEVNGSAHFEGRYLHAREAFVRLYDNAHVNLGSSEKVYAAVNGGSSIYFYGPPNSMTKFVRDNGVILSVLETKPLPGLCYAMPVYRERVYKDAEPIYGRHVQGYYWKNRQLRAK